jgi:hypothetical protein
MRHEIALERLPDLLSAHDDELMRHVAGCHDCQRRLFLLQRVHAALRAWQPVRMKRGIRRGLVLATAAAVAVACTLAFLHRGGSRRAYTVAVGPSGIVQATLARGDGQNDRLDLQARRLPRPLRTYLLWGRTSDGRRELLGRFMVDRRGSCKVRLSLPHRVWASFAVTGET